MTARRDEAGIALVAVLWTALILSLIATLMISGGRTEARISANVVEHAKAKALAMAGINRAILALLDRRPEERWIADGRPYVFALAGAEITITIQDEYGRIDLNAAPEELLASLFRSTGLDEEASATLAATIADWRDEDVVRRKLGAERDDYAAEGFPYAPRDAPFESIEELLQLRGMTQALQARLRAALTVHSMRRFVDPETAPPEVLRALPGMDEEKVASLLDARQTRGGDIVSRQSAVSSSPPSALTDLQGRVYVITARAETPAGIGFSREVTIRLTGDLRRPFWVQGWRSQGGERDGP